MYRVFESLDALVTIVEEARGVPMTANCVVPRGDVLELLDDVREALPGEVDDAQDVLDRRDEIVAEAEQEAEHTRSSAHADAEQLRRRGPGRGRAAGRRRPRGGRARPSRRPGTRPSARSPSGAGSTPSSPSGPGPMPSGRRRPGGRPTSASSPTATPSRPGWCRRPRSCRPRTPRRPASSTRPTPRPTGCAASATPTSTRTLAELEETLGQRAAHGRSRSRGAALRRAARAATGDDAADGRAPRPVRHAAWISGRLDPAWLPGSG